MHPRDARVGERSERAYVSEMSMLVGAVLNPVWTYEGRPAACKPCGQPNSLAENLGMHCEFWGCTKTARVHPQDATVKFLGSSLV